MYKVILRNMPTLTLQSVQPFDYQKSVDSILKTLRRDRDRQVIARRFGFDMPKRQTLERIGHDFGITRERVRQIEKATLNKIKNANHPEVTKAGQLLAEYLKPEGGVARIDDVAQKIGADTPEKRSYIVFLAALAPDIELIDENDQLHMGVAILPQFKTDRVKRLINSIIEAVAAIGKPAKLDAVSKKIEFDLEITALTNLMKLSKDLAHLDGIWGLVTWPEVNPKSIRDKTYLVLGKHGKPLHFSDIATKIKAIPLSRRDVTVQAVHNELIKDPRFILIGRGIYALAEWGYTPGTVADIIAEILRQEAPLHKDEIVKRVLSKRQVKTTTIILNLQEKEQFERVEKATYKLKDN
jgi:DNA-directed RNA polymerase delta subunit